MTTTEEIIVSGENFVERRIILCPEQDDIQNLQEMAYSCGYKRGCKRGLLVGLAIIGFTALCVWLAIQL